MSWPHVSSTDDISTRRTYQHIRLREQLLAHVALGQHELVRIEWRHALVGIPVQKPGHDDGRRTSVTALAVHVNLVAEKNTRVKP